MDTFDSVRRKVLRFCKERDWRQYHTPKDMAISLCLEAAEVLEHFQWLSETKAKQHVKKHLEDLSDELADVAIYLIEFTDVLGINLVQAIENKLKKNAVKYPVKKIKGRHTNKYR